MTHSRKKAPPAPPFRLSPLQDAENKLLSASNALQHAYEYAKGVPEALENLKAAALAYAEAARSSQ